MEFGVKIRGGGVKKGQRGRRELKTHEAPP